MTSQNPLLRFPSKQKAIDLALWTNFSNRIRSERVGVILSAQGDYLVVPVEHPTFKGEYFEKLPKSYKKMGYKDIQQIRMDADQLEHWEDLFGIISTCHGELLRFILAYRLPLEKMIRYELACRGYDKDHQRVGFKTSQEIWLK